jgi:hypothetical protein
MARRNQARHQSRNFIVVCSLCHNSTQRVVLLQVAPLIPRQMKKVMADGVRWQLIVSLRFPLSEISAFCARKHDCYETLIR